MAKYTVDQDHLELFGRITVFYAYNELGFKMIVAWLAGVEQERFWVMASPYNANDLYNVSKSIVKLVLPDEKNSDRVRLINLIGEWKRHSTVRNHIAHAIWTTGTREDSIRPVYMNIREGRADGRGYGPEEKDYTLDELIDHATALEKNYRSIQSFIVEKGFAPDMAENTPDANASSDSSDGRN